MSETKSCVDRNIHLDKHIAAGARTLWNKDYKAHISVHTYCERGEGHAHAPEAIESKSNEDKDGEFCKKKTTIYKYIYKSKSIQYSKCYSAKKTFVHMNSPFGL